MRCPCCNAEVDRESIAYGKEMRFSSGRVVRDQPLVLQMLQDLLDHGEVPSNSSSSTNVIANRVRDLIKTEDLPYQVRTDRTRSKYVLVRLAQ